LAARELSTFASPGVPFFFLNFYFPFISFPFVWKIEWERRKEHERRAKRKGKEDRRGALGEGRDGGAEARLMHLVSGPPVSSLPSLRAPKGV
tara:strand:- start:154 stop:429 length:276 start_codon:yes stop_codon:yes gene_type:complete